MKIKFKVGETTSGAASYSGWINTHQIKVGADIYERGCIWLCKPQVGKVFGLSKEATKFTIDLRWKKPKSSEYILVEALDYDLIDLDSRPRRVRSVVITILESVACITGEAKVWVKLVEYED